MSAAAEQRVPTEAAWLGGLGAIPFVGFSAGAWFSPEHASLALVALRAYGAVILSFLGGVHWGLAMRRAPASPGWSALTLSVMPSLVAWPALLLAPRYGLAVLAVAVALMLYVDTSLSRQGLAASWYPRLRQPLSVVVTVSLIAGALAGAG